MGSIGMGLLLYNRMGSRAGYTRVVPKDYLYVTVDFFTVSTPHRSQYNQSAWTELRGLDMGNVTRALARAR
jgi:hypothetical protein